MSEWFASGRIVDAIVALVAIEVAALALLRHRLGLAERIGAIVWNALAGVFLLLALRAALAGSGTVWIAACLLAALVAHLADLRYRLRG